MKTRRFAATTGWGRNIVASLAFAMALGGGSFNAMAQSSSTNVRDSGSTAAEGQTSATMEKESKSSLSIAASVDGSVLRDDFLKSNNSGASFNIVGDRKFGSVFKADLDLLLYYVNGNSSSLYVGDGDPGSGAVLYKASLTAEPTDWLEIRGGVLPINFSTKPSLFRTTGFLGSEQLIKMGDAEKNGVGFTIRTSQTIPTAGGSEKAPGSERKTPLLFVNGAELDLESDSVEFGIGASYFSFNDLPRNLASSGALNGNTILGVGSEVAEFAYRFEGWQASSELEIDLTKSFEIEFGGSYLVNTKAPSGLNTGYSAKVGFEWEFKSWTLEPEFQYLVNERDTLPASYVSSSWGKNNRRAFSSKIAIDLPEEKVSMYGRWVRSLEIEDLPFTADRNIFLFGLEAQYDVL